MAGEGGSPDAVEQHTSRDVAASGPAETLHKTGRLLGFGDVGFAGEGTRKSCEAVELKAWRREDVEERTAA